MVDPKIIKEKDEREKERKEMKEVYMNVDFDSLKINNPLKSRLTEFSLK